MRDQPESCRTLAVFPCNVKVKAGVAWALKVESVLHACYCNTVSEADNAMLLPFAIREA